jgi:hypothetical protein
MQTDSCFDSTVFFFACLRLQGPFRRFVAAAFTISSIVFCTILAAIIKFFVSIVKATYPGGGIGLQMERLVPDARRDQISLQVVNGISNRRLTSDSHTDSNLLTLVILLVYARLAVW